MSRNARIGISVVVGIVAACLCVCACGLAFLTSAGVSVATDPAKAQAVARQIADYKLPAGYRALIAYKVMGFDAVMFRKEGSLLNIGFMQWKPPEGQETEGVPEALQLSLKQAVEDEPVDWKKVDQQTRQIRGQQVEVEIYEGENAYGTAMRMLSTAPFDGKSGIMYIFIAGEAKDWPQAEIDQFLDSIQ